MLYIVVDKKGNIISGTDGVPLMFDLIEDAATCVKQMGYCREEICSMTVLQQVGLCVKCGKPLFPSIVPGYSAQCFCCDEDFYDFEQNTGISKP